MITFGFICCVWLMVVFGPEYYLQVTELRCNGFEIAVETFGGMNECIEARKQRLEWANCACLRPQNPLAPYYYNWVVPILFAVLGSFASRGTLLFRFALLNAAIIVGGVVAQIYMWQVDPIKDPEGLFFGYLYILQMILTASALFGSVYTFAKLVRKCRPPNQSAQPTR